MSAVYKINGFRHGGERRQKEKEKKNEEENSLLP
jgi:hypothetical protein